MIDISYPLLLDGGLSNELKKLGCDLDHKLWTAKMLPTDIELIVQVHLNYLNAGAKIITTTGYQASIPGLMNEGWTKDEAKELILKSVWAAEEARHHYINEGREKSKILIAASIGPYGAYLADGSEYKGDYDVDYQSLIDFHKERIDILNKSNADVLAFETFPDYREAQVISKLTSNIDKPAWISFTTRNGREISDGTTIEKCTELFADHSNVFAIGVNCLPPERVSTMIKRIKTRSKDKKIIVYPNSGDLYDSVSHSWKTDEDLHSSLVSYTDDWIDLGAHIIGGCCRVGPTDIKRMSLYLSKIKPSP